MQTLPNEISLSDVKQNQHLQKKIIESELKDKQDEKKFQAKKEKKMHELTAHWQGILKGGEKSFENALKSKKLMKDWYLHGLPSAVRGQIWRFCIGNDLQITKELFEIQGIREKKVSEKQYKENIGNVDKETSIALIQFDLPRTFPSYKFFQAPDGPLFEPFRQILTRFVIMRSDMGYTQGMSYIAALLLMNMDTLDAFIAFSNLILSPKFHFQHFYRMNMVEITRYVGIVKQLLKKHVKLAFQILEQTNVDIFPVVFEWFITLFSSKFEIGICSRIWDVFLQKGEIYLFQVTLGIFKYLIPSFKNQNNEFILQTFSSLPVIKERILFRCIHSIKLKPNHIEQAQASL